MKQVSGTLIIKDAVVEDSGKYLCVVNNSVGGESVETVLTVTAPLSAKIDPPTQTIDFGRPAVFTCQYTGNPIKTVSWMKDGKAMGHSEPVLRIESVKKEDKGMYQCFVRNDQESAEASAELKLGGRFDPPVIRQAFQEETMEPGPSVFLKCVAGGNPTPEISWELDGKKIANNDRFQVGQYVTVNGDVVSYLNITSVHANDGGLYKCIAKSKVGVAEHSAKLNVYGLPYIRQMEKKAIVAGETLMVTCPVAGYPIDSIVWERGKWRRNQVQDLMYKFIESLQITAPCPSIANRRSSPMAPSSSRTWNATRTRQPTLVWPRIRKVTRHVAPWKCKSWVSRTVQLLRKACPHGQLCASLPSGRVHFTASTSPCNVGRSLHSNR